MRNNGTQELTDEELRSLTIAIKKRYGIDFTNYELGSLKRGFSRLIMKRGLGSVLDLWTKILKEKNFIFSCIDDLTVNLTELFRNPEIWVKVREGVLSEVKHLSSIRIWHAGCSTGEEVYTMAIVLKDKGLLYNSSILATDLNAKVIETAREGKYSLSLLDKYNQSFAQYFPSRRLSDCFYIHSDSMEVKSMIKYNIDFKVHNLVQDAMFRDFEIIFCRNVMIYFDDVLKMKVLKLFYDRLSSRGFFIIGFYDMLPAGWDEYFELYDASNRIYRKKK